MTRRSPSEIRQLVCDGRWGRKHLLVVQREYGDESLFDALFGVFTDHSRPDTVFQDQQIASRHLLELCPACHVPLEQAIRSSLRQWNVSIEELPFYFWRIYGRDAVLAAVSMIEADRSLSEQERKGIETFRYWLSSDEKRVFQTRV